MPPRDTSYILTQAPKSRRFRVTRRPDVPEVMRAKRGSIVVAVRAANRPYPTIPRRNIYIPIPARKTLHARARARAYACICARIRGRGDVRSPAHGRKGQRAECSYYSTFTLACSRTKSPRVKRAIINMRADMRENCSVSARASASSVPPPR